MLAELQNEYDSCLLEYDGLTRVLHTVLDREGIEHTCFIEEITDTSQQKSFAPHLLVELPDHTIIDYRAQMWLGKTPEVPHGAFGTGEYSHIVYRVAEVQLQPLAQNLFDVLTGKFP